MTRQATSPEKVALETLVDACGLDGVLYALSEIAGAKAAHIAANDQNDHRLAGGWSSMATHIDELAAEVGLYLP